MNAQKETLCSPFYIIFSLGKLCCSYYLKSKCSAQMENSDPTVYNLCLVGALRDKTNNFGLTQRQNPKNPCHFHSSYFALQSSLEFHCWKFSFQHAFQSCTWAALPFSPLWLFNIPDFSAHQVQVPFHIAQGRLQISFED